ncbi:MAG: ADP-ribosylglycohydrolase family protein [Aquificaceae bacterium]|uniref:ADP-ribosylglycohydrolase family protein n=1 Tax=Hydrogenobacter sp. Uz 6-8 TaxID=3384828 RepID=UPI003098B37D
MDILLDRFKGVILGGALGDAIGKGLEDVPLEDALRYYGAKVRGFVEPHPHSPALGLEPEKTSDETTISILLAQSIVERRALDPYHFFEKLREWAGREEVHRYPDPALLTAIDLISSGTGLEDAGFFSSSVEGVLRCTITGLFHYYSPHLAAEAGRLVSLITHRSREIYDASAIVSALISYLLLESFDLKDPVQRLALLENLKGFLKHHKNRTYLEKVRLLLERGADTEEAIEHIGNSTFVFEALPLAIFIFLHHTEEPLEALWDAVNACGPVGGDTDAIGYLVGSFVGAYRGLWVFPAELLENLENYEYYILLAEKLYHTAMEFLERRS